MKPFRFVVLLFFVTLFGPHCAFGGEPTLKPTEVIELADAAANKKGVILKDYSPPKACYVRKDDTWFVHYRGKVLKPGGFFEVSVHDKTKNTKLLPGA